MVDIQSRYKTDLKLVKSAKLDEHSKELRSLIMRAIINGGRGHVGAALSMVETIRVLYEDILHLDPTKPQWQHRDRYILSKGHGCLAVYAQLAHLGFFDVAELDNFCKFDSILSGHPEIKTPGIEASTGALGHGMPIGVGIALGLRNKKINSQVFVHMGDGEINEGSVWEAALCASKHNLANLNVIVDYNKLQSAGSVEDIQPMEPLMDKWLSFGFDVKECNGHDISDLRVALKSAYQNKSRPTVTIAHTIKGKGIPMAEDNPLWHHKARLSEEDKEQIKEALEIKSDA